MTPENKLKLRCKQVVMELEAYEIASVSIFIELLLELESTAKEVKERWIQLRAKNAP